MCGEIMTNDDIKILAIDQARNGAWAIFDYQSKKLVTYGTFSYDNKSFTYANAILAIENLVDSLIKSYGISAVFIEDIQLRANVQSFKKLAQLQGVLVNLFEKNEYLYDFVAPSQWQNYCKARGRIKREGQAGMGEKSNSRCLPENKYSTKKKRMASCGDFLIKSLILYTYVGFIAIRI